MNFSPTKAQIRLRPHARLFVQFATLVARFTPFRIPHRWVCAVTNRAWQFQFDNSPWLSFRIDHTGKVVA